MRIFKRSVVSACLCEAVAFALAVVGTETHASVGLTLLGRIGRALHWAGMVAEAHVRGDWLNWLALVGVPFALWFLVWVAIWFAVETIRRRRSPNQAVEAIGASAPQPHR